MTHLPSKTMYLLTYLIPSVMVIVIVVMVSMLFTAYKIGQDKGRLNFYEDLYGEKLECRLTVDDFITNQIGE